MRITINTGTFATEVAWLARLLPSRIAVPVLAGVHLATGEGSVRLTVYDYETSGTVDVDAHVSEPGTVLVSGRALATIAALLPEGADAHLAVDGPRLTVTAGDAKFTLPTLPIEDYPTVPAPGEEIGRVDAETFSAAVGQVIAAVSTDATLPMICAVQLRLGERLSLAGTDRYRIAQRRMPWNPTMEAGDADALLLVPPRTLHYAARTLSADDHIGLGVQRDGDGGHVSGVTLSDGHRTVSTRLIAADPPTIERLFAGAAAPVVTATVNVERLRSAARRAGALCTAVTPVVLDIQDDHITVEGGDGDAGGRDVVPAVTDGQPHTVAVRHGYLLDCLDALVTEQARLLVPADHKPLRILPDTGEDAETAGYRYLLMPVRRGD
ncbi:DNA polymerase III subunit beta [Marinactinospora rubrisoli]|uniref:DNA polymerase III subunit beta n=1 Tax=Marinactinospora rubrisoli TaxID=2715399 RepID=A0ABW2KPX9_9ACTN